MSTRLQRFQDRIDYRFCDGALLERALTHASYGDGRRRTTSNERLEFLGDRVLGLLAAERLFTADAGMDEGGLAHRLNAIVNKQACARAAERCALGEALQMSPAEERLGGREKMSILGDACEAIIGALYLDGGIEAAGDFFETFWGEELDEVIHRPKDPKSRLQEWAAHLGCPAPVYATLGRSGPDHRPVFTVEVAVDGLGSAQAQGSSKQEAQRAAAQALLESENADDR